MIDPFLEAHRIGPREYDLSNSRPFAIRDQLIRARLVVERAYSTGRLPNSQMLIKGAGVAGVGSAAHGASLGIRSVIIERETKALRRLAECSSRWVEPTHYDWPHDHWNRGKFAGLPLPYESRTASALSWNWRGELFRLMRQGKTFVYTNVTELTTSYISEVPPIRITTSGLPLEFNEFDLMLDCTGPGDEICNVGSFEGFRFWQTDPFGPPDLGLHDRIVPRVLISGAGDGARRPDHSPCAPVQSPGRVLSTEPAAHASGYEVPENRSQTVCLPAELCYGDYIQFQS